jgi:hypothetical protein
MTTNRAVIDQIRAAFIGNTHPGEAYVQGSTAGCEPFEEMEPFRTQADWQALAPEKLDRHADALSFFSEAGFRFFLPAYLIADLRGDLARADPLFHLTSGFFTVSVEVPAGDRVFVRKGGGATLINPKRYGGITFENYARYRLSAFTREEAKAIVAYLQCRRERDTEGIERPEIDAALEAFWLDRAEHAPTAASLEEHVREEDAFLAQLGDRNANET